MLLALVVIQIQMQGLQVSQYRTLLARDQCERQDDGVGDKRLLV